LIPKNRPNHRAFRLFEIGRTFFTLDRNEANCIEVPGLAGIAFQRAGSLEELYFSVKSAVEEILKTCGVQNVQFVPGTIPKDAQAPYWKPWWSEGHYVEIRTSDIRSDDNRINSILLGTLGILDKDLTAKVCRTGGQIVWFDINLIHLDEDFSGSALLRPEVKFEEPPANPLSWMDFSLLWSIDDDFGQLESVLDRFKSPLLMRREFLESYKGKGLQKEPGTERSAVPGQSLACYSFRFWIGSPDHTLSGEEIDSFHQQFLAYIKEQGVSLRM
jgi:phenylalanyl-tRNA synthetase beta subunit